MSHATLSPSAPHDEPPPGARPFTLSLFLRKAWAILLETLLHPFSRSIIVVRDGRVTRRRVVPARRGA